MPGENVNCPWVAVTVLDLVCKIKKELLHTNIRWPVTIQRKIKRNSFIPADIESSSFSSNDHDDDD